MTKLSLAIFSLINRQDMSQDQDIHSQIKLLFAEICAMRKDDDDT